MKVKALEKLRRQLEMIGATLDDESSGYTLNCDAPSGYVWRSNGCTTHAIHYATNHQSWLVKAIQMEMRDLKMGLEKVTDPEEIAMRRHELDNDNWGAPDSAPLIIDWQNSKP